MDIEENRWTSKAIFRSSSVFYMGFMSTMFYTNNPSDPYYKIHDTNRQVIILSSVNTACYEMLSSELANIGEVTMNSVLMNSASNPFTSVSISFVEFLEA